MASLSSGRGRSSIARSMRSRENTAPSFQRSEFASSLLAAISSEVSEATPQIRFSWLGASSFRPPDPRDNNLSGSRTPAFPETSECIKHVIPLSPRSIEKPTTFCVFQKSIPDTTRVGRINFWRYWDQVSIRTKTPVFYVVRDFARDLRNLSL